MDSDNSMGQTWARDKVMWYWSADTLFGENLYETKSCVLYFNHTRTHGKTPKSTSCNSKLVWDDIPHSCNDQVTAVKTGYPLTSITWPYRGLKCRPIEATCFLKSSAEEFLVFDWSQAQDFFSTHTAHKTSCAYEPAAGLRTRNVSLFTGREGSGY